MLKADFVYMTAMAHRILLLTTLLTACALARASNYSDAELAAQFSVNGLRVSTTSEVAIINDQIRRVGDFVGEAEIVAIDSYLVHMRIADRTFAMRVGSSVIRESDYATQSPDTFQSQAPLLSAIEISLPPKIAEREYASEFIGDVLVAESYWPVAPGETLFEIAASLASTPDEHADVMATLYADNPEAFGGSVDVLYAGARLAVPGTTTLLPEQLAAAPGEPVVAAVNSRTVVQRGDTLSAIAVRLAPADITLNQAMLAIFEANPDAFGGNINLLYAAEILEIPGPADWLGHSPQAALAEVVRQASVWRTGFSSGEFHLDLIKHNAILSPQAPPGANRCSH